MDLKKKVTISWSGGKDSAFALYKIGRLPEYEVTGLHTVINAETKRVGMHGVREELIEQQAALLGLPLTKLYLESSESHAAYEALMKDFYWKCSRNIDAVVFGDIFLEDLKKFREGLLKPFRMQGIFPLWKLDTRELIEEFFGLGFKTILCSADEKFFSMEQLGKTLDLNFISELPGIVDPCGENGEFHTFVYDGRNFSKAVEFGIWSVVKKEYRFQKQNENEIRSVEMSFWFQDLFPRITS